MANPKILGSITFALLLVSGFLALKNKAAYEREINNAAVEKSNMQRSSNQLKELQAKHNGVKGQIEDANQTIATLTEQDDKLKRDNLMTEGDEKDLAAKVAEFQGASDELAEQEAKFEKVRTVVDKLTKLGNEIKQLDGDIASKQAELDKLTAVNAEVDQDVAALREVLDNRSQGRSLKSLRTSIRAIYSSWGFVTLQGGDSSGVVLNSTLDVLRGGQLIGKLLVTAVERNSASASIIPGSVSQGVSLMIGDVVVPSNPTDVAQN